MQYRRVSSARWKSEEGSAIVELTLLVPLFLLMLLGTADFARVFYTALSVSQAARAGVQYGAQDNVKSKDTAGMQKAAQLAAQDIGTLSTVTAGSYCQCADSAKVDCVSGTCPEGSPQIYVIVTAGKIFQTLWHYPGIPHSVALSRTAIMRVQ